MRDNKKSKQEKTPEQEELEKHVDDMMDPAQPDKPVTKAKAAAPVIQAVSGATDPEDAPKTAPALSPKLKITVNDASDKPLSIDKLDEQIKSITEADTPKKPKKASKSKAKKDAEPVADDPEINETSDQEDITDQSMALDDEETDKAVDDIVAYEGDVVLAVADSTAAEHNREFTEHETEGHPILTTTIWTLVALAAILIVALVILLVMGDSLADKLGL